MHTFQCFQMIPRDFEISILDISGDYEKTGNSENFGQKWSDNSKIDPQIYTKIQSFLNKIPKLYLF